VEVGAIVWCMGRALFGLSLGELEEWPGSSQPVFQSFRRVFQTVWQGYALGNGGSIEGEERVEVAVDEGDLLAIYWF
jgi:hypothetical protein